MEEKSLILINSLLENIPAKYKDEYTGAIYELSEYAISLGYKPKKNDRSGCSIYFVNQEKMIIMRLDSYSSVKKEVKMKRIKTNPTETFFDPPSLRLKVYGCKDFPIIFKNSLKKVIEDFDGRYTGCYGCGKCGEQIKGYIYIYPDGKKVFRCGGELITIIDWNKSHVKAIKKLIKEQNEYLLNNSR